MIKIKKAKKGENLDKEWEKANTQHFGKPVQWKVEKFRYKATSNGEIVGKVTGKIEAGTIFINSLITKENFRGKGVGSMLIQKVEKMGKEIGAHKMWLLTGENWSEREFYKKRGYKIECRIKDFYLHQDFVIYTKRI